MQNKPMVAALAEHLIYVPTTGHLLWRKSDANGRLAGSRAECRSRDGYLFVVLPSGRRLFAHRVAWLLVHGRGPKECLDHINRIRDDNRLANLREATRSQNNFNSGPRTDNVSGHRGVSWFKRIGKWRADISIGGRRVYLGSFATKVEAAAAYKKAACAHYGTFADAVPAKTTVNDNDPVRRKRGETVSFTLAELEEALGFKRQVLANRLKRGWPLGKALLTPQLTRRRA